PTAGRRAATESCPSLESAAGAKDARAPVPGDGRYICYLARDQRKTRRRCKIIKPTHPPVVQRPQTAPGRTGLFLKRQKRRCTPRIVGPGSDTRRPSSHHKPVEPEVYTDLIPGDHMGKRPAIIVACEAAIPEPCRAPERSRLQQSARFSGIRLVLPSIVAWRRRLDFGQAHPKSRVEAERIAVSDPRYPA